MYCAKPGVAQSAKANASSPRIAKLRMVVLLSSSHPSPREIAALCEQAAFSGPGIVISRALNIQMCGVTLALSCLDSGREWRVTTLTNQYTSQSGDPVLEIWKILESNGLWEMVR